jgi:hypothetical protein
MNRERLPYVVSGAFALQAHTGIWRDTKDLDLFLPPEHVPRALDVLKSDGFECEVCDNVWLAKARRGPFFVDLITGMSNAVITVEQSWIDRAKPWEVMGVPSRVLGPEELIASKLFVAFRERFDGADICHVIYGTRGRMDWDRLQGLLGAHYAILLWALVLFQYIYPGQSHFIPREVWDALLDRFRNEVDNPDKDAAFRGSLIDENMFAIDVKEWGLENVIDDYRGGVSRKIPTDDVAAD